MKKLLSTWQEPALWLPIIVFLGWLCTVIIPKIDPKAGVDSLGYLSGLMASSALIASVFFFTWLYHRTYDVTEELDKKANSDQIRKDYPLVFFLVRNSRDLVVLLVVLYCFLK